MGTIWEVSLGNFLLVTVFLGGGAAYMTGRAVAITWRPLLNLLLYILLLNSAVRFIHFSLFSGTLISPQFYLVDFVALMSLALLGFRITRTYQMAAQYSWLYERTGPLTWRRRAGPSGS